MIEFLAANWLWFVAIALFVAMHRGGHGCGMHDSHDHHTHDADRVPSHQDHDRAHVSTNRRDEP